MAVTLYKSTDASAPQLTGQTGSLTAVLDAVLVNGYGAKAAAGWTIAYTGTSKRVYTMAAGGTGFSMYVDDAGPGAATFKEARVQGFEVATGLGTGTNPFPTSGQTTVGAGGPLVIRKSTSADSTTRGWTIIANGQTIYLFIETGDVTSPLCSYPFMFGDFFSYSSGDLYNCMIIGRIKENVSYTGTGNVTAGSPWSGMGTNLVDATSGLVGLSTTALADTIQGHFVARNYTGVGGSIAVGKRSDVGTMGYPSNSYSQSPQLGYAGNGPCTNAITTWPTAFPYPNGPDNGLYTAPVFITHGGFIRGYMKGFWNPLQHQPLGHLDTYSGTGNLAGKSFIAIQGLGTYNYQSSVITAMIATQMHVEYSDTWN